MGADLIVEFLEMKLDFNEAVKKAQGLLDADFEEIRTNLCEYYPGFLGSDDETLSKDELMAKVRDALEVVYDYNHRRDCAQLVIDDKIYALTGGMSYGDDPTDAYNSFSIVAALALTTDY